MADFTSVNQDVIRTLAPPGRRYLLGLLGLVVLWGWGAYAWMYWIYHGLGVLGLMHPVMWAVLITNFVFWVGIAHSGTLISAILFLFRARFRTTIYRAAEAMTVFALMTAGLFPIMHLGRSWYVYWLIPYPNQRHLWVNFRSPLVWDVFAVSTYIIVSIMFLYTGLLPDIAVLRDRFTGWRKKWLYGPLSLGWQGTDTQWRHYTSKYIFLAALATPLVLSVHSVVSWDFAMSILPGWHSTIFAPYFVAGAIFSGTAMVITLLVPIRKAFKLEEYIDVRHFDRVAQILLLMSLIVTYSYINEFFMSWYSEDKYDAAVFHYRAFGTYAPLFWILVVCNSIVPLSLFSARLRRNIRWLFAVSILVNIGMWVERFVIIVTSLARDFDPYNWGTYAPKWPEYAVTVGSFAWFLFLFLVFIKFFPSMSIAETKSALHEHGGLQ